MSQQQPSGKLHLNNCYWLLRHGRSLANEASIICSKLDNGIKDDYTLSQYGVQQAEAAGKALAEQLQGHPARPLLVYASPFSRTQKTAQVAVAAAGLDVPVQTAPELRERYFGAALELQNDALGYGIIWEHDAQTTDYRPGEDGESVEEVAARVRSLFQRLEAEHSGACVLLVSHGDTLSITCAAMTPGAALGQHRRYAFDTAELRRLC